MNELLELAILNESRYNYQADLNMFQYVILYYI